MSEKILNAGDLRRALEGLSDDAPIGAVSNCGRYAVLVTEVLDNRPDGLVLVIGPADSQTLHVGRLCEDGRIAPIERSHSFCWSGGWPGSTAGGIATDPVESAAWCSWAECAWNVGDPGELAVIYPDESTAEADFEAWHKAAGLA